MDEGEISAHISHALEWLRAFVTTANSMWHEYAPIVLGYLKTHHKEVALFAGFLQVIGYMWFIRYMRYETEPNPITWLMFAYGVIPIVVFEFDVVFHATLEEGAERNYFILVLPVVCAMLAIYVAMILFRKGRGRWPRNALEWVSFIADVLLTIAYVGAWALYWEEVINQDTRSWATIFFLVASNATALTAFMPTIADTYRHPERERTGPWLVWAFAYVWLGVATYYSVGETLLNVLLIYPVLNTCLHALVGVLALSVRRH